MKNQIRSDWDRMAEIYHPFVETPFSYSRMIILPGLQHLLPDIHGWQVLDAGCGSGHSTFFLEELGAESVTGIDFSAEMIRLAQSAASERGSRSVFQTGDVEDLSRFANQTFDLVTSINVTHFLPGLDRFANECARVLRPGGTLIWSVIHPVYSAQYPLHHPDGSFPTDEEWQVRYLDRTLRTYVQPWLERKPAVQPYLTSSYHYTLSDYLNTLIAAGFRLEAVQEPLPLDAFRERHPNLYEAYLRIPTFMQIKAIR